MVTDLKTDDAGDEAKLVGLSSLTQTLSPNGEGF
jgi:hypothetical protein